jgi:hypothetical protein
MNVSMATLVMPLVAREAEMTASVYSHTGNQSVEMTASDGGRIEFVDCFSPEKRFRRAKTRLERRSLLAEKAPPERRSRQPRADEPSPERRSRRGGAATEGSEASSPEASRLKDQWGMQ